MNLSTKLIGVALTVGLLTASCASKEIAPGQLAMRAIEVRPIDAPYDVAFRAATHALFALGLTVKHTEKSAGILTAGRSEKHTGQKIGWALLCGICAVFIDTDVTIDVTLFVTPAGDKQTRMRIGLAKDGEIVVDQHIIDGIWVITQREALIESGESVPPELEAQAKQILSPPDAPEGSTEQRKGEQR